MELSPGDIMNITDAMRSGARVFESHTVSFMVGLAYASGRRQRLAEDLADVAGRLFDEDPATCRARRVAQRRAEYETRSGPARYRGGPVAWDTGMPINDVGEPL